MRNKQKGKEWKYLQIECAIPHHQLKKMYPEQYSHERMAAIQE